MAWSRGVLVAVGAVMAIGCGSESLGGRSLPGAGGMSSARFGGLPVLATGGSSGTGSGGVLGTGGGQPYCGDSQTFTVAAPVNPDILILMDRSSSLLDDGNGMSCTGGCGSQSKWALLTAAVEDLVVHAGSVNWGLMFFGTDDACGVNPIPAVPLPSAPNTAMLIVGALQSTTPGGEAPTAAALSAAAGYLGSLSDASPKYILLVTDGRSGCNSTTQVADLSAENEVAIVDTLGFPTFVLASVAASDASAMLALNQMALNGAEPQTGSANAFYSTTDDLSTQLEPLVEKPTACVIPLAGPLPADTTLSITFESNDGSSGTIPNDPMNGWQFTDSTHTNVIFDGQSCSSEKSGAYRQIIVTYICGPGWLGHSRPAARSSAP